MIYHKREYPPQEVAFNKIPNIKSEFLKLFGETTKVEEKYTCEYGNKQTTYNSMDEFVKFIGIRKPESVRAKINANYIKANTYHSSNLELLFYKELITSSISEMKESDSLALLDFIEKELGLKETLPTKLKEPAIPHRSAFLAHSFDDTGEDVANKVKRLLELLNFKVITGKNFSSKSISGKVKERVSQQGIVICILSKKWETTGGESLPALWVTQEAAFSEGLGKPVFIFLEDGIKKDLGIHGDIEYIPFSPENLTEPLLKLLEGLNELGYKFSNQPIFEV
jgi:hypothetical protein